MMIYVFVLLFIWAWAANRLLDNFAADIEELPWWRATLLTAILVAFAPIFFAEELLEILIDVVIE